MKYYNEAKKICNVSMEDCKVLIYKKMLESARLLTGNKALRKRAEGEGITVSGILFVFDEFVNHGIISPKDAAAYLAGLVEKNIRLPKEEVEKRSGQWSRGLKKAKASTEAEA